MRFDLICDCLDFGQKSVVPEVFEVRLIETKDSLFVLLIVERLGRWECIIGPAITIVSRIFSNFSGAIDMMLRCAKFT